MAKKKLKKVTKPTMTVTTICVPVNHALVDWPEGSGEVPTYDQLCETLDLVALYHTMTESGIELPDFLKPVEEWMTKNSLSKFVAALNAAEKHQRLIDINIYENGVFPFPLRRFRRDN